MSAPRVLFFGDSICFGQYVSPHRGWVTRIAAALGERAVVMNPSVSGNTTRQALERIAYDLQAHEPAIVFVQFGMNDCNQWETDRGLPRVSARAFAANLEEIVDRSRRFGARTVFLNTNHPASKSVAYGEANRRYNELVRTVASDRSTELVDMEAAFELELARGAALKELLLPDGVHLSPAGHDIYYEEVRSFLEAVLE